jgi:iron complex transport system ATP-binding protein
LDGAPVLDLPARERGRRIAYLPQDRAVHWPLTARAVVALGRRPHGGGSELASAADRRAVAEALAAMDATQFASRLVTEMSGGERARVLVARALAQEAEVLIADEPTAGLDPAHALALAERLAAIAAHGRSVVWAVHDLGLAARVATRMVALRNGEVIAAGPPGEVLSADLLARVFGLRARLDAIGGVPVIVVDGLA